MRALPLKWDIIEQMGDIPKTRDEHTANVYENAMIIFGGFVNGVRTNEIFRYNFNTRRWDMIRPVTRIAPPARAAHSAIIYKDSLVIFGGKDEDNEKLNDVWSFNFRTHIWEQLH